MARFYGSLAGSASTEATRQGTPRSGISGHVRGWNLGVRIVGYADGDRDAFTVEITAGSHGHGRTVTLAELVETADGADLKIVAESGAITLRGGEAR